MDSAYIWLLLLVLVFPAVPAAAVPSASPCSADLVVSSEADLQRVFRPYSEGNTYIHQRSYMQPREGFLGLSVEVRINNRTFVMFFKAQDRYYCFTGNADWWWKVGVMCDYSKTLEGIDCYMHAGNCYWYCWYDFPTKYLYMDVELKALGSSSWRISRPKGENCTVQNWVTNYEYSDRTCRPRPGTQRRPADTINSKSLATTTATLTATTTLTTTVIVKSTTTTTTFTEIITRTKLIAIDPTRTTITPTISPSTRPNTTTKTGSNKHISPPTPTPVVTPLVVVVLVVVVVGVVVMILVKRRQREAESSTTIIAMETVDSSNTPGPTLTPRHNSSSSSSPAPQPAIDDTSSEPVYEEIPEDDNYLNPLTLPRPVQERREK